MESSRKNKLQFEYEREFFWIYEKRKKQKKKTDNYGHPAMQNLLICNFSMIRQQSATYLTTRVLLSAKVFSVLIFSISIQLTDTSLTDQQKIKKEISITSDEVNSDIISSNDCNTTGKQCLGKNRTQRALPESRSDNDRNIRTNARGSPSHHIESCYL